MSKDLDDEHIPEIQAPCREFGVARLQVFVLPPGDESALLVTFTKGDGVAGVGQLARMEERLETVLGRDVTLLTDVALRNGWLRNEAWPTRSTLYEAPARYPFTP